MLSKQDAIDLFQALNTVSFKGEAAERVVELKNKLRAIINAKEEPCPTTNAAPTT